MNSAAVVERQVLAEAKLHNVTDVVEQMLLSRSTAGRLEADQSIIDIRSKMGVMQCQLQPFQSAVYSRLDILNTVCAPSMN